MRYLIGQHLGFYDHAFVAAAQLDDKVFQHIAAEYSQKIVVRRDIEHGRTRVALTSASAAQLVVNTARFVPFGTYYPESAQSDDLFFFLIRFLLEQVVIFLVVLPRL